MKLKSFFLLFFLLFFVGLESVYACMCMGQQSCQSYADADAVFVGKVLDSTETDKKIKNRERPFGSSEWEVNEYVERRQISRLNISENFTGIKDKKEILIETEVSTSCGIRLEKDATYLIYAKKVKGESNLRVFACAGTKPISYAKKDLEYLRTNKEASAKVSGDVDFDGLEKTTSNQLTKYGVTTVVLENEERQFQTTIKTDASYSFENIPSGKYNIKVVLPESLTIDDDYHPDIAKSLEIGNQNMIEVAEKGCSVKNFLIKENGRVSGRLTDAGGKPIENITVYLMPISKTGKKIEQEELCYDTGLCLDTDKNGEYSIKALKAGNYLVGVRLGKYVGNTTVDAEYFTTYYPSVMDEKDAVPVKVKAGQATENINFTLTKKYIQREIKGKVVFSDGRPATKVRVRYATRTPDSKNTTLTFIKTDENGNFSFIGYETYSYLVGAFTDSGNKNGNLEAIAVTLDILPEKDIKKINLVLNQDSSKTCEKCGNYFDFPKSKTPKKRK